MTHHLFTAEGGCRAFPDRHREAVVGLALAAALFGSGQASSSCVES